MKSSKLPGVLEHHNCVVLLTVVLLCPHASQDREAEGPGHVSPSLIPTPLLREPPQQVLQSLEAALTYWKWKQLGRCLASKFILDRPRQAEENNWEITGRKKNANLKTKGEQEIKAGARHT